jgi:hypothetical protein
LRELGQNTRYAYGMPHLDDFPMSDEEFEQLKDSSLGGVLQIPQADGGSAEGPDRRRSLVGDHDLGHELGISLNPEEILSASIGLRRSGGNPNSGRDTFLSSPSEVPLQR